MSGLNTKGGEVFLCRSRWIAAFRPGNFFFLNFNKTFSSLLLSSSYLSVVDIDFSCSINADYSFIFIIINVQYDILFNRTL